MSDDNQLRRLLAYLGAAEIACGVPAHETERDVRAAGVVLGAPNVQIEASPGGVMLSLGGGSPATFETVEGGLRLDQAASVTEILDGVLGRRLTMDEALDDLVALRARAHPSPVLGMYLGGVAVAIGLSFILQPAWATVVFSLALSPVVTALTRLAGRGLLPPVLLPLSATFLTGLAAFWAAQHGWIDGPLRTVLPCVAVLLPGATLVPGIAELVSGAMSAGAARLSFGAAQLLMFSVGLAAASGVLNTPAAQFNNKRADDFGAWSLAVGIVLVAIGIALMEAVPARFVPWVLGVLVITLLSQVALQTWLSAPAGGFGGALVSSLVSSALARRGPRIPRLVSFLPSFWLLVPGSLGLLSVSGPAISDVGVADVGLLMLAIALGMVIGTGLARIGLSRVSADGRLAS